MNKFKVSLLLACTMAITGATNSAKASLILNGSFESHVLPGDGFYQYQSPTFWGGASYFVRGSNMGWPSPQDGNQFEIVTGGYVLQQQINVPTSGSYILTWWDNGYVGQAYSMGVSLGSAHYDFSGNGSADWNARSITVNLSAGFNTVAFFGGGNAAIDNVSLEAVAVPEPSTYIAGALLFLPFGAHLVRRLRGQMNR